MYCPKCDMDFVEGIKVCADCGGPLVDKEEYLEEQKKKLELEAESNARKQELAEEKMRGTFGDSHVFVKTSDRYQDIKSSAQAFAIVGFCLVAVSVFLWIGLIKTSSPGIGAIIIRAGLSVVALAAILFSVHAYKEASGIKNKISDEEKKTSELLEWFTDNYSAESIDAVIKSENSDLLPEEKALKRMDYIQDVFLTGHDLTNQSYVDALSEEVYSRLFMDEDSEEIVDDEDSEEENDN